MVLLPLEATRICSTLRIGAEPENADGDAVELLEEEERRARLEEASEIRQTEYKSVAQSALGKR